MNLFQVKQCIKGVCLNLNYRTTCINSKFIPENNNAGRASYMPS